MGSFALWYFGYDYKYEKRFNGNVLLNRNFNYAIALEVSEGLYNRL
ncbi:protein of unknown function [Methanocaldococcus lauensis]|nr:protein of unknown function [Methanocaldococcus lauensis]